jgi:NAD(P)H-hydrate repair Nnr-like enzyme with NAD(P)H-hydrate dehydratase domain
LGSEGKLAARLRLAVHAELRVLHVGRAHGQRAGNGGVGDVLAAHIDGALGRDLGGRSVFSAALSVVLSAAAALVAARVSSSALSRAGQRKE